MVRKMPASLSAERAVLGSILLDPASLTDVLAVIRAEDFYVAEHQQIFLAMRELYDASCEIDHVTLVDALVHRGVYEKAGGEEYVRALLDATPGAVNVMDYARIVKEESTRRAVISICNEVADMTYTEKEGVGRVLDYAQGQFNDIAQGRDTRNMRGIKEVLCEVFDNLHQLAENGADVQGLSTGFSGVDRVLVGMGDSDLIILGARPGMGKTSFALNIATNVAANSKKAVCVFSLEMSAEQLVSRLLSSEAMVDSRALRSGQISKEDWEKLGGAAMKLSQMDLWIDDTAGITVSGIKSKLRRVKNLGFVVIDYMGLMESEQHYDNRALEVGVISRGLKLMAKELHIPILCCAQLSRGTEGRTDKRPQLSDLRESGSIEQDADVVMFLYRDEYYKAGRSPEDSGGNTVEVIVQKNRHGSTGNIEMGWIGQYTKFVTLDNEGREES